MAGGWARDGAVHDSDRRERRGRRRAHTPPVAARREPARVRGVRRRDLGRPSRRAARRAPVRRVSERARWAGHAARRLQPPGEQGQPAEVVCSGRLRWKVNSGAQFHALPNRTNSGWPACQRAVVSPSRPAARSLARAALATARRARCSMRYARRARLGLEGRQSARSRARSAVATSRSALLVARSSWALALWQRSYAEWHTAWAARGGRPDTYGEPALADSGCVDRNSARGRYRTRCRCRPVRHDRRPRIRHCLCCLSGSLTESSEHFKMPVARPALRRPATHLKEYLTERLHA